MTEQNVTSFLQQVLQTSDQPEVIFSKLMPKLGEWLQCDRCFLYVRHPSTKMGKVVDCWRRSSQFADLKTTDWQPEPASLPEADPLFAAALQAKPSVFVEDVETADPGFVNRGFEQENFGHRALIHAHLVQAGNLWGVLQPCVFGRSRIWSTTDRKIIEELEQFMTPFVISYVKEHFWVTLDLHGLLISTRVPLFLTPTKRISPSLLAKAATFLTTSCACLGKSSLNSIDNILQLLPLHPSISRLTTFG